MKNFSTITGYIFALFLTLSSFFVTGSSAEDEDITIRSTRDFVIRYFQKTDETNLTLKLTYQKKEKSYKICLNPQHENLEFDLAEPINREYFKTRLNDELDKITNTGLAISQASFEEVSNWVLDATKVLSNEPLSGRLLLKTHVIIPEFTRDKRGNFIRDRKKENINYKKRKDDLNNAIGGSWAMLNSRRQLFNFISTYFKENGHKKISGLDFSATMDEADGAVEKYFSPNRNRIKPPIWDEEIWNKITAYRDALRQSQKNRAELAAQRIFPIKKVDIQIERGFLERIQVWLADENGELMVYDNIYAIGFSSVKNFKFFTKTLLFPRAGNGDPIYLSDIFSYYENALDNYTRDYSPADTSINNISPEKALAIDLYRAKYVNLFDTKIYTDVNGMNQNSPNGLVQIEASRKFNLKTSRQQFLNFRSDVGFFTYLNTYGSYNKIEKDQKYLRLRNENVAENGVLISPSYATNLDFRRYENFSLGTELNTFLFDWPDGKITAFLDFGGKYGHTPVTDYVRDISGNVATNTKDTISRDAHTFTWYPKVSVEVFAEKRIGLILTYQFNNTLLFSNNDFKQIKSYTKSDLLAIPIERSARRSHMVEFYLRAETSKDRNGRVFLRARFFLQSRDINTFFPQFQVGYAYNLVFKK